MECISFLYYIIRIYGYKPNLRLKHCFPETLPSPTLAFPKLNMYKTVVEVFVQIVFTQ